MLDEMTLLTISPAPSKGFFCLKDFFLAAVAFINSQKRQEGGAERMGRHTAEGCKESRAPDRCMRTAPCTWASALTVRLCSCPPEGS